MIPIHEKLVAINAEQSIRFEADESARLRNWAKHPTFFACVKCMDGRVSFSALTKVPVGTVKAFCAIGGKFEIWWPSFVGRVRHWTERAISKGSKNVMFVTYHYSGSDEHLGCAGWKYDTKAARAHAEKLQRHLADVFGEQLTAIAAGVETDLDLLTLHGPNGDLSGEMLIGKSDEEIHAAITHAFPGIDPIIADDLVPFMRGNAERVKELTDQPREPEAKGHQERVIAVGQGFNWLVEENVALMINDADPSLAESIRVAASIIEKNLSHAKPGDDATIFTQIPYRHPGIDHRQAVERAKGLRAFAEQVVREAYPDLFNTGRVHTLSSVLWEPNKKLEVIESL